ncbi:putative 30S ribosomal protein S20 [Trichinella spiralis]|uniref:putative 30S ribosomal protein S20 n=1 Tax=Trichinella spiralis TaxID=6334 RepID=UPI0001EFCABA|nr:putative 30S ribosomal protein S20 [Trichinella spiralis]
MAYTCICNLHALLGWGYVGTVDVRIVDDILEESDRVCGCVGERSGTAPQSAEQRKAQMERRADHLPGGKSGTSTQLQYQAAALAQGSPGQGALHGLEQRQASRGVVEPRRQGDRLGCVHDEQRARDHHADHVGDGLRLLAVFVSDRLRRLGQQVHHISVELARGYFDQKAGRGHAHQLHVLLHIFAVG